ncbi:uncharacterized protein LOC118204036 isoform X2 [Stegodyphus dumicola]|nr:uncharacterized protein LOC118204036 isoform X2 [Stegodyphus dumicola]XP_035232248.1 uncharacterized protein LOC118204036 isoform X2 [Stegodyphus dumicola]
MPTDDSTSSSSSNESPQESNSGFQVSLIGGHNIWEWIFLVVATCNVALLLASSGVAVVQCDLQRSLLSPEFTTEVIVILVSIIALSFAIYGVHEEHQFDIYLHAVFITIADAFSYLVAEKINCYHCFKFVCFFVAIGLTVVNYFMIFKATTATDWTEFRIIGASESLAVMYKKQCAFLALLKFDALFVVICAIYSFPITLDFPNKNNLYLLLSLIIMYSFMSWCCGKVTVCKEDKYLASGFVVLCITYPCLVIYQMYMSNHKTSVGQFHLSAQYIGIIIIACKFLLSCLMIQTCRTFGYGLNTRSLDILKKWLDRPSKKKPASERMMWFKFLKECCHLKCSNKTKKLEYTYKDIYRF